MPGTNEEYVALACDAALPRDFHLGRRWADGTAITLQEAADVRDLWVYRRQQLGREFVRQRRRGSQHKAMRLLRRYLSPGQLASLRRNGEFLLELPSGTAYRLDARRGRTEEVTRHGRRWFVRRRFCLHEHSLLVLPMPPADLVLTHMLLLLADEREFLETANATDARDELWNGPYARRLREARLARTNAAVGSEH